MKAEQLPMSERTPSKSSYSRDVAVWVLIGLTFWLACVLLGQVLVLAFQTAPVKVLDHQPIPIESKVEQEF